MQALLVIDMQGFVTDRIARGIDFYPDHCIENMRSVIALFRAAGKPIFHVRHETPEPGSMLHKNSPHFLPVVGFEAQADEKVFTKRTSSAFSSTDLYTWLEHKKIVDVAVIGAVAGYCVNSTIRMGSDLGLAMTIVRDAVLSFPLEGAGISAAEVFNVTLGLLEGEFAQSVNVADLTFNPR